MRYADALHYAGAAHNDNPVLLSQSQGKPHCYNCGVVRLRIKRGNSLELTIALKQRATPSSAFAAVDITGWVIAAQVRNPTTRALVAQLTSAIVDAPTGTFRLSALATATATWPLAKLLGDIRYQRADGYVFSTEDFEVEVRQEVTAP